MTCIGAFFPRARGTPAEQRACRPGRPTWAVPAVSPGASSRAAPPWVSHGLSLLLGPSACSLGRAGASVLDDRVSWPPRCQHLPHLTTVKLCQGQSLGSSDPPGRGMSPWWPGLRLCSWWYFKLPRTAEAFTMTPPGAGPKSGCPCQHSPESARTGRFNMPDTQQVLNKCAWKRPSQGTFRRAVNSSFGMELSRESLQVPVCLQGDLGQIT